MDQVSFGEILRKLSTATRGASFNLFLIEVYWPHFEGRELRHFQAAANECSRQNWFPTVNELLAACDRAEANERLAALPKAEPDWELRRDAHQCQLCRDTGEVDCWHPVAQKRAMQIHRENGDQAKLERLTCSVPCVCERGAVREKIRLRGEVIVRPRYDSRKHVALAVTDAASRAVLWEWVRTEDARRRPPRDFVAAQGGWPEGEV